MNSLGNEVSKRYLFAPSDTPVDRELNIDQLWKGIVTAIRKSPSVPDAMLLVTWFWSKNDIISVMKDQCSVDLDQSVF